MMLTHEIQKHIFETIKIHNYMAVAYVECVYFVLLPSKCRWWLWCKTQKQWASN